MRKRGSVSLRASARTASDFTEAWPRGRMKTTGPSDLLPIKSPPGVALSQFGQTVMIPSDRRRTYRPEKDTRAKLNGGSVVPIQGGRNAKACARTDGNCGYPRL